MLQAKAIEIQKVSMEVLMSFLYTDNVMLEQETMNMRKLLASSTDLAMQQSLRIPSGNGASGNMSGRALKKGNCRWRKMRRKEQMGIRAVKIICHILTNRSKVMP